MLHLKSYYIGTNLDSVVFVQSLGMDFETKNCNVTLKCDIVIHF